MAFILPAIAAVGASAAGTASAGAVAASTAAAVGGGIETASIPLAAASTAAAATPWLGYASLASTLLGGVSGAVGSIQQGQAAKAAGNYNAEVADANAAQAKNNATIASQSGDEQAGMQEQKTRALVGAEEANTAASGIDVNSGSAVDVRASSTDLGMLDAITVRSQATREAYGYNTQAASLSNQATVDRAEGEASESAGVINAGSTLLGAGGSAASNFAKYQLQGGFSV